MTLSTERWERAKLVLADALEVPEGDRDAFVSRSCAGDAEVEREVRSLLSALATSGDALEAPAVLFPDALDRPPLEGRVIGGFRVVRLVAQGGMGAVFEAIQESPNRRVAIKVMRRGLYLADAARRFRHEIEILGRLQHPSIAQVFEAGVESDAATGERVPWFAMEWVDGEPLTKCAARLPLRERLRLFLRVCEGVEAAHRRGVVHRDLKPDNVLVDAEGRPKILDFGIARATASDGGLATFGTSAGELLGTLAYMSPEQVSGDPEAVDLRSDVYALGVVLYETLSGALPIDLRGKPIPEAARLIQEKEPRPLSALDRSLGGDLEVIVTKALEKDRDRRYGSAGALASDIERYLADEAILARPPSTFYVFSKFARRNRGLVAGVAAAFLLLVAGTIGTTIGLVRATRERDRVAESARQAAAVVAFLNDMLASADPEGGGRDVTVLEVLSDAARNAAISFADQPLVRARLEETIARTYHGLGDEESAERHARQSAALFGAMLRERSEAALGARTLLAEILVERDDIAEASREAEETLRVARESLGSGHAVALSALESLALARHSEGRLGDAEALHREALAGRTAAFGPTHDATLSSLNNLAGVLLALARTDEALEAFRRIASARETTLGADHPRTLTSLSNLALALDEAGKPDEAVRVYRDVVERQTQVLGPDHPRVLTARSNLGSALAHAGALEEGADVLASALADRRRVLGSDHDATLNSMVNLAILDLRLGRFAEAETLARECLDWTRGGGAHPQGFLFLDTLSNALAEQGRDAEAAPYARSALALAEESLGPAHPRTLSVRNNLAKSLEATGEIEAAIALFESNLEKALAAPSLSPRAAVLFRLNLGRALATAGRRAEAERHLVAAAAAALSADGPAGSEAGKCIEALAALYERWERAEEAAAWRRRLAERLGE